jgi:hypothetical protein
MNNIENSSMNKELYKWIKETKKEIQTSKNFKEGIDKKPSGPCAICGEKPAKTVCLKCGKSVCQSCHFKIIGVCKKCVPKETAEKWEGKPPDWEKILGVEWLD